MANKDFEGRSKGETILKKAEIDPQEEFFSMTKEEAINALLEVVEEFGLSVKLEELSKEELETLLRNYADSIFLYHPESYHQERGAFLKSFEMLEKYGLTEEDYSQIDFA